MKDEFSIQRLWFAAEEGVGRIPDGTNVLSMTESQSGFVEWSGDDSRKRQRNRVFMGDLWVLPQGQNWWVRPEHGKTCIQLSLSSEWLRQITHSSHGLLPQVQLRDGLLTQLLRKLADTATNLPRNPTTRLYQESLATSLVLHLVTQYGRTTPLVSNRVAPLSSVRLRAISDYVAEHISENILLAMRVDRARELLVAGRDTLADIAAQTGFADQSHLTRHMRRRFGVTPGAFKK